MLLLELNGHVACSGCPFLHQTPFECFRINAGWDTNVETSFCLRRLQIHHETRWGGSASLEEGHVNGDDIAFSSATSFEQIELGSSESTNTLNAFEEILNSRVVIELGTVARGSFSLNHKPPGTPLSIEYSVTLTRRWQTFVEHDSDVQGLEEVGFNELLGSIVAADLFIGDEGEIDGSEWVEARSLELAYGLEVLHPNALHVLRTSGINVSLVVHVSVERVVCPLGFLEGNHIGVGVEENGRQGWVRAYPFEEKMRLSLYELVRLRFE